MLYANQCFRVLALMIVFLCVGASSYGYNYMPASKQDIKDARTVAISAYDPDYNEYLIMFSNIGFSSWLLSVVDDDGTVIMSGMIRPDYRYGDSYSFSTANVQFEIDKDYINLFISKDLMNKDYVEDSPFSVTLPYDKDDSDDFLIIINSGGSEACFDMENSSWKSINISQLKNLFNQYNKQFKKL